MARRNELLGIIYGILLLLGMHSLAIAAIFVLGYILFSGSSGYAIL